MADGGSVPLSRKCGMRNAERGMGKEKWQMTNGGWQMTNGGWRIRSALEKMRNAECGTGKEKWQMTNGGWGMANAATKRAIDVSRVPESGWPLPLSAMSRGPDGGKTP